ADVAMRGGVCVATRSELQPAPKRAICTERCSSPKRAALRRRARLRARGGDRRDAEIGKVRRPPAAGVALIPEVRVLALAREAKRILGAVRAAVGIFLQAGHHEVVDLARN